MVLMPALQRGSVTESGRGYSVRYRDADGRQRRASGFRTPTAARRWLRDKTDEVAAQRRGRSTFDSWDDVRRLASKLSARFAAVPLLGVATALRPEELFGLQRADIDRGAGVLHVRRVLVDGEIKSVLKTDGSLRDVPL